MGSHSPLVSAFLLLQTAGAAVGITCYQCTVRPPPIYSNSASIHPCADFDYSSKYLTDCPHSTFCMKTTYTLPLPQGRSVTVTRRACAPQKSRYQKLQSGQWVWATTVDPDLYEDGCSWSHDSQRSNPQEHCYCSYDFCNTAQHTVPTYTMTILLILPCILNVINIF